MIKVCSRSVSREIEPLRYIPVEPKWKLFCRTARRKKYPDTAQWSIFTIVKETENSQAAFHGARRSGEFIPAEPRCLGASDVSINFRQSDTPMATAVLKRASEISVPTRGEEKKLPFYSISRKELAREKREALIGERCWARRRDAIGKRLLTREHRLSYHFNGILNSRRRVPKLMQSQFPGSCAWYISDFPPLRYRPESSPSHAAVPERLLSPNNRLLPSANWSACTRSHPRMNIRRIRLYIWDALFKRNVSRKIICHDLVNFRVQDSKIFLMKSFNKFIFKLCE